MSRESVLVTGGAGFIGRALVMRCLQEGHAVTVVDNLCAGRLANLEPVLGRIDFCQADILDAPQINEAMARARPTIVFHLAAHHFIPFCDQHPCETLRVNVEGTYLVLSEAARLGVRVAVVASSGAVYPSRDGFLSEELAAAPIDVYALSKHMAEQVALLIASTTPLACVSARIFNTYGPYETNPHLIPHIVDCLRRGSVVQLGNVHTKRDYVFVEDVAALLWRCAQRAAAPYTAVNVGTGSEYSAAEIVQTMGEILGREIAIDVDPARVRSVDKLHQRADTTRLEALSGMRPEHSLPDGLRRLLVHEGIGGEIGAPALGRT